METVEFSFNIKSGYETDDRKEHCQNDTNAVEVMKG